VPLVDLRHATGEPAGIDHEPHPVPKRLDRRIGERLAKPQMIDDHVHRADATGSGVSESMLAVVSGRATVEAFWAAMQENDWSRAAAQLAPECEIDWPCSGERIVGREDFVAIQARYPTKTGRWSFDVHRIVAEGDVVVSEVTVTDGEQAARVVAFSVLDGDRIAHQIEYWPTAYDPLPGREDLTRPIARVP
jgi:limonene-1,2-epoxide hydrolase